MKKHKIKFHTLRGIGKHISDKHLGYWKMLIKKKGRVWICKICDWDLNNKK